MYGLGLCVCTVLPCLIHQCYSIHVELLFLHINPFHCAPIIMSTLLNGNMGTSHTDPSLFPTHHFLFVSLLLHFIESSCLLSLSSCPYFQSLPNPCCSLFLWSHVPSHCFLCTSLNCTTLKLSKAFLLPISLNHFVCLKLPHTSQIPALKPIFQGKVCD